jgi:hypothetical protein
MQNEQGLIHSVDFSGAEETANLRRSDYRMKAKLVLFLHALLFCSISCPCAAAIKYAGVNLAGAEFGQNNLPGTYNIHYTSTQAEVDYFRNKGMNIIGCRSGGNGCSRQPTPHSTARS